MSGNAKWLVVIAALLIGVFIGYAIERQRAIFNMENAKLSMQKLIDETRMTNQKPLQENKQLQIALTPTPTGVANKITATPSAIKVK